MTWFRVDDGLADHPKVLRCSLAAMGLWVKAGAWCGKHLTDGNVPRAVVSLLGGTRKHSAELVASGLWEESSEGFRFHDWHGRNPTRTDVEHEREQARERMRNVRANRPRTSQEQTPNVRESFGNPVPTRPDPSRPVPTTATAYAVGCEGGAAAPPPAVAAPVVEPSPEVTHVAVPTSAGTERKRAPRRPRDLMGEQIATAATWDAYAVAFRARYDQRGEFGDSIPTRNAKVNGQLAQLVKRVPAEEAPDIAAHYVRSNQARYVAAGHPIGLLLQDAEKLRTEWLTGRRTTAHQAREVDRREGRSSGYADAIARLEAEDRERAHAAG